MTEPVNVVMIIGSTRQGRFAPTVAQWAAAQLDQRDDVVLDVIDLADTDLPSVLGAPTPEVEQYVARLDHADAFVVVTPEYNHGYPASLKQGIDVAHQEWFAKPVAFVSYGGVAGGARAVEQLRQVFAELHTATMRDTVSFNLFTTPFDDDGQVVDASGAESAGKKMVDELLWWARALRAARHDEPYAA
jgi:NAD(P)H-dependent FMN reductase